MVVAGVAGFAFYQYKKAQKEMVEKEKEGRIFPTIKGPIEINKVSIKSNTQDIHFYRKEDGWWIKSPIEDIADSDLIGDWLDNVLTQKVTIVKKNNVDLAEYDLDQNIKSIKLVTQSNEVFNLDISNYSAFDGSFYLKKGEELLLGSTSWASITSKEADYFRSYKLSNHRKHPTGINFQSKSFSASLKWENYKWSWKDNASSKEKDSTFFSLSSSALESYWSAFNKINFDKTIHPNTTENREKFKLLKPNIEIKITFENNKKWSIALSEEIDKKNYVLVSNRDYIFSLDKDQYEKLILTEKKIRDHRYPFQFEVDKLHSLYIKGYGLHVPVKKTKKGWVLLEGAFDNTTLENNKATEETTTLENNKTTKKTAKKPDEQTNEDKKLLKLNSERLESVLNEIRSLEAKKYFRKNKKFDRVAHVVLKDKEGKEILKLEFGQPIELKNINDNETLVYATSNQEVMAVESSRLKAIFSAELLQKNEGNEKDK